MLQREQDFLLVALDPRPLRVQMRNPGRQRFAPAQQRRQMLAQQRGGFQIGFQRLFADRVAVVQPVVQQRRVDPADPCALNQRAQQEIVVMHIAMAAERRELLPQGPVEHEVRGGHEHIALEQRGHPVAMLTMHGLQCLEGVDPPVPGDRFTPVVDQPDVATHQCRRLAVEQRQAAFEPVGCETVVRIEDRDVFTTRFLNRLVQGVMRALIGLVARDAHPRVVDRLQHGPAVIGRGIVPYNHLDRHRLRQRAGDRLADIGGMVVAGDDDAD